MEERTVRVRLEADGTVSAVELEGVAEPTEVVGTTRDEPIASFGDEEYKARARPWLGGG